MTHDESIHNVCPIAMLMAWKTNLHDLFKAIYRENQLENLSQLIRLE